MRSFLVLAVLLIGCGTDKFSNDGGVASDAGDRDQGDTSADAGPDLRAAGNLVLWLDGSRGTVTNGMNRVTLWSDQSGKNNNAHEAPMVPGPVLVPSALAGRAVVHFEMNAGGDVAQGTMLAVDDNPTFQIGTGPFLLSLVTRWNNDVNGSATTRAGTLFNKRPVMGGAGITLLANNLSTGTPTGGLTAAVGTSIFGTNGATYNDNAWRIVCLVRAQNQTTLRVAGMDDGSLGGTQDVTSATAVLIGAVGDTAAIQRLNGDIAEMLLFTGNLPPIPFVEAYLKTKYNL